MMQIYDIGGTCIKEFPQMYDFVAKNATKYMDDQAKAKQLIAAAKARIEEKKSFPDEYFSDVCDILVDAYEAGDFHINHDEITYHDTVEHFQSARRSGIEIGILTAATEDFGEILFGKKTDSGTLADLVDDWFPSREVGDKKDPDTFAQVYTIEKGQISAYFDDNADVCKAAKKGFAKAAKHYNGKEPQVYLVDRNKKYDAREHEDEADELENMGIEIINNLDEEILETTIDDEVSEDEPSDEYESAEAA